MGCLHPPQAKCRRRLHLWSLGGGGTPGKTPLQEEIWLQASPLPSQPAGQSPPATEPSQQDPSSAASSEAVSSV